MLLILLNYVWNEVIVNLRSKILYFGLDTFYDNAIGANARDLYKSEDDLVGIKPEFNSCKLIKHLKRPNNGRFLLLFY